MSLASVAGARTTQSSFPAFLASTNPSDINIDNGPYDPSLLAKVARLPGVTSLQTYVALNLAPIRADGTPDFSNPLGNVEPVGPLDRLYLDQDKVTIVHGRMLDPRRADEVVISKSTARTTGLHVGDRIREGIFSNSQLNGTGAPDGRGRPAGDPRRRRGRHLQRRGGAGRRRPTAPHGDEPGPDRSPDVVLRELRLDGHPAGRTGRPGCSRSSMPTPPTSR